MVVSPYYDDDFNDNDNTSKSNREWDDDYYDDNHNVLLQAFIIGWTSEFIPKMVYKFKLNDNHDLSGYVNHSLSYFNVSDFQPRSYPDDVKANEFGEVTVCRSVVCVYRGEVHCVCAQVCVCVCVCPKKHYIFYCMIWNVCIHSTI